MQLHAFSQNLHRQCAAAARARAADCHSALGCRRAPAIREERHTREVVSTRARKKGCADAGRHVHVRRRAAHSKRRRAPARGGASSSIPIRSIVSASNPHRGRTRRLPNKDSSILAPLRDRAHLCVIEPIPSTCPPLRRPCANPPAAVNQKGFRLSCIRCLIWRLS